MNGDEVIVREAKSHWRVDGSLKFVDRDFFVIIFIAVGLIGGDFPSEGIEVEAKLGQFVGNLETGETWLRRDFVAKSDTVVKHAKTDSKEAFGRRGLGEIEGQLVIVINHFAVFAPDRFPDLVDGFFARADKREILADGGHFFETKAKAGGFDDGLVVLSHRIGKMPRF